MKKAGEKQAVRLESLGLQGSTELILKGDREPGRNEQSWNIGRVTHWKDSDARLSRDNRDEMAGCVTGRWA